MPIYEYVCSRCGNKIEALVFSQDDEKTLKCTSCGSSELNRVVSRCFSFSGGGSGSSCVGGSSTGFS